MKSERTSQKNNIIFFALLFLLPILALDVSFYFLAELNREWEKKEQKKTASQEAEVLASEGIFENQFSTLFKHYCDVVKSDVQINFASNLLLSSHLEQTANIIFREPFPEYNLHVFRIPAKGKSAELLFSKGDGNSSKKALCFAFEHLYNLSVSPDGKLQEGSSRDAFARNLVGQFSNVEAFAKELRGRPTHSRVRHKSFWFIWDYAVVPDKGIVGAILTSPEIFNHEEIGRKLALRNLQKRGRATGAFIPVYKDYGKPMYQHPLEDSELFLKWAESITIQKEENLEKWMMEDLPQGVQLGKYTAYTYLERGASHFAVILVRAIEPFSFPKWVIFLNIVLFVTMLIIICCGLFYETWPPINLKTRFGLSYFLASVLPMCLLSVTAYGYILQYRNTSINQTVDNLQDALKSFDIYKASNTKDYKTAFTKALSDEKLIEIIKEKGINDPLAAKRVIDIFENDDPEKSLPILGIKVFDEAGEGAFAKGSAATNINIETYINSFLSAYIYTLRSKIITEDPNAESWMKPFQANDDNDLAGQAYIALTGNEIKSAMNKHQSVPIPRKNGDFCSLQVFDFIKIDGKTRYVLFVVWDDMTLDDRILQNAFDSYSLKNGKQSFMGLRMIGQNMEVVGKKTRHASTKTITKANELAKFAANNKRMTSSIEDDTLIVAMPSANFSQTVLLGWMNLFDVERSIFERQFYFLALLFASIIVLAVCSFRSVGVFLLPVASLKKALDEVSAGNLNVALESRARNELGTLSNEFSAMIEGLREKEKLSKLISDQAVQALEKRGDDLLNDTETFEGVALVSDIRNFTGISEKNDPMVITDLLNEHFAEMTKVISANGGLIYKFIGDAIEAVFPEKKELKDSGSERAFKAGCMMISTLARINRKRKKRGLFTYKMGVGLCKGVMHSGTVGSFETRLDYAILGNVMKKAAKFEGLSVQNPPFPIVIDEAIAEKLVTSGFSFKKIDSKSEEFSAFVVDQIGVLETSTEKSAKTTEKSGVSDEKDTNGYTNGLQVFALQNTSEKKEDKESFVLAGLLAMLLVFCVFLGANSIFATKLSDIKAGSNQECTRLLEQLNSDSALKNSFEALCLEFFEKTRNAFDRMKSNQPLKEIMLPIEKHFEVLGTPMPKYFCCKFKDKDNNELSSEDKAFLGFTSDFADKIASIPIILRKTHNPLKHEEFVHAVMGNTTSSYNIRTSHFRRTYQAPVNGIDMFVETNRIFYPELIIGPNEFYGFVFCAMPVDFATKQNKLKYYTLLAGKNCLLAFNKGDNWIFSHNFPEKEKRFLQSNSNDIETLADKGYCIGKTEVDLDSWNVYAISTKLCGSYISTMEFNFYLSLFVLAALILGFVFWKKNLTLRKKSVAVSLGTYLGFAAIIPLLTVVFLSYLYVNEDYNVKKAEKKAELQHNMDVFEIRDRYFQPFCWNYVDKISRNEDLKVLAEKANNAKTEEEKKETLGKIRSFLKNNLVGNGWDLFGKSGFDPHLTVQETVIFGTNNWSMSVTANEGPDNVKADSISDFGKILVEMGKSIYLPEKQNVKPTSSVNDVKGEYVVEKIIDALSSTFGQSYGMKLLNFPYNPMVVSVTYTTIGALVVPLPNTEKAEFAVITMVYFNNEKLCDYSCARNELASITRHIEAGGAGDETFIYSCTNVDIGRKFFKYYHSEDLRTLKELLAAASWVNSSNLPVSRIVDLNGPHYIEARPGNQIGDSVFLALASDSFVRNQAFSNIFKFAFIILLSVMLIILIAKSIVSDLLSPINILIVGAKSAERGIYSFRANYNSGDELGALCKSFDKMMKGLEEKQLMNRMVSKTALNVASSESEGSSNRVDAFLLYVSVPGFDDILQKTPPQELFANLKKQIATISKIVLAAGGDIDKIMGEKMLIAFHIHDKTPVEVALAACEAAYRIETDETLSYKVAVGVNYGQVISGFLGVGEKRDFTVIGDPVNVAARIAALAEKQDYARRMVSEPVKNFVSNKLCFVKFGEVSLKGKSELLTVYRIS